MEEHADTMVIGVPVPVVVELPDVAWFTRSTLNDRRHGDFLGSVVR
jgi:hypothetical protein